MKIYELNGGRLNITKSECFAEATKEELRVLLALIEGKDTETTINLLVNAIVVIQDILKNSKKAEGVVGAHRELTKEEIRGLITKGL